MATGSDMKYTAFEIEIKGLKLTIGACVVWGIAAVILTLSGHLLSVSLIPLAVREWLHLR